MTDTQLEPTGYFGVVIPNQDKFTGAFLTEDPARDKDVRKMLGMATQLGDHAEGNLSAVMVEGFTIGRPDIALTAALAFVKLTGKRWFYVVARPDGEGVYTELRTMDARTVEDARIELQQAPEVLAICQRLAAEGEGREPS